MLWAKNVAKCQSRAGNTLFGFRVKVSCGREEREGEERAFGIEEASTRW